MVMDHGFNVEKWTWKGEAIGYISSVYLHIAQAYTIMHKQIGYVGSTYSYFMPKIDHNIRFQENHLFSPKIVIITLAPDPCNFSPEE
jgi:hypothetical protein